MRIYLTKSGPALQKFAPPVEGEARQIALKFRPASAAELKALGDELPDGYVAGWASTDDLDLYRHKVMKGAFQAAITERGLTGPRGIKLLINHSWQRPAGLIKKLEYRGNNLWIEAQLNLNIGYAKDMYEASKMIGGLSFSVGFMLEKYAVEGDEDQGGEWLRIDKGDLYEVSVVPFPANEEAQMTFVKSAVGAPHKTVSEFEKALVASGLVQSRNDANRVTQVVKANSALFFKGSDPVPAPNPTPPVAPPVLAVEKLSELSALVAKMRETIAS